MTAEYPQYLWSIRPSNASGPTPTAERAVFESRYASLSDEHRWLFMSFREMAVNQVHDIIRNGHCPQWIPFHTRRIVADLHKLHISRQPLRFDAPDDKIAYENLWYRIGFMLLDEAIRKKDLQAADAVRKSIMEGGWLDRVEFSRQLAELAKDNYLIIHQTNIVSAKHIMQNSPFFSDSWLSGTSLIANIPTIEAACKTVDGEETPMNIIRHKWADSLVVLCFPKKLLSPGARPSLDAIDAILPDMFSHCWLPNRFMWGYWNDGHFVENQKFSI